MKPHSEKHNLGTQILDFYVVCCCTKIGANADLELHNICGGFWRVGHVELCYGVCDRQDMPPIITLFSDAVSMVTFISSCVRLRESVTVIRVLLTHNCYLFIYSLFTQGKLCTIIILQEERLATLHLGYLSPKISCLKQYPLD